MKAQLLVLHRKEHYFGEHAPEILAVVDEYTLDNNPSWWNEEVSRQKDLVGDDAAAWAVVRIELPQDRIMDLLYPANQVDVVLEEER